MSGELSQQVKEHGLQGIAQQWLELALQWWWLVLTRAFGDNDFNC